MLAARQLKLPKKRRSLQARTHVLRGDCGGRASTSHSLPKTRCLPSPPSPKHSCGASMKFGRFISLPLLAASFYCASTLRTSAPSISQCTASTPSSTRVQHFLHPEHSQRLQQHNMRFKIHTIRLNFYTLANLFFPLHQLSPLSVALLVDARNVSCHALLTATILDVQLENVLQCKKPTFRLAVM